MFDDLILALDAFEEGMAKATMRKRGDILSALNGIETKTVTMLNGTLPTKGTLPAGSKSILLRIKKLIHDTHSGVENKELSFAELRNISRDKIGVVSKALKLNSKGSLHTDQKGQVSEIAADDTYEEIRRLVTLYNPKNEPAVFNYEKAQIKLDAQDIEDLFMTQFSDLTVQQIRALDIDALRAMPVEDIYSAKNKRQLVAEITLKSDDEMRVLSESYKKLYTRLPTTIRGPFTAIRYPVVPLFKDLEAVKNPQKLERAGLQVTRVGDHFIVLENQYLLCLNTEELDLMTTMKYNRDKTKFVSIKNKADDNAAVLEILKLINQRSSIQYTMASHTIVRNPRNPKIALVWIVPERTRLVLEQTLRTRQVDWDIPRHNLTTDE